MAEARRVAAGARVDALWRRGLEPRPSAGGLSLRGPVDARPTARGRYAGGRRVLLSTRKRVALAETWLEGHLDAIVSAQHEALLRLDVLHGDMSDTAPDGDEPADVPVPAGPATADPDDGQSVSTPALFAFALGGNALGLFFGLGAGLGEIGSLPVLATTLLGGGVAVILAQRRWPFDSRRGVDRPESRVVGSPAVTGTATDGDDLEALGRRIRRLSSDFEVEVEDDVLRVQHRDRG